MWQGGEITFTYSGECVQRHERVQQVIAHVEQQLPGMLWRKVAGIEDYKGELIIRWRVRPNEMEESLFNEGWEQLGSEPFTSVRHIKPDPATAQ